jgi:hypothetical protein
MGTNDWFDLDKTAYLRLRHVGRKWGKRQLNIILIIVTQKSPITWSSVGACIGGPGELNLKWLLLLISNQSISSPWPGSPSAASISYSVVSASRFPVSISWCSRMTPWCVTSSALSGVAFSIASSSHYAILRLIIPSVHWRLSTSFWTLLLGM